MPDGIGAAGPGEPLIYEGSEPLEVKGEARYQDTLRKTAEGRPAGRGDPTIHVVATLRPEPLNPYDEHAVGVHVDGLQVGYLGREDAAACEPAITRLIGMTGRPVALRGVLVGGFELDDGTRASYGIWLRYDPAAFGRS